MRAIKTVIAVGARPNFMKAAPLVDEMKKSGRIVPVLVHTGQHYDEAMSGLFFEQLGLPEPDYNLGVGSASHAQQTAEIMRRFEPVLLEEKPDLVTVVGDVNSTLACTLTAAKLNIPVAHVEAGLRSFDRTMPEEINRLLTDAISNFLFITERSAWHNLVREGIPEDKIYFVGNTMIDTLLRSIERAAASRILEEYGLKGRPGSSNGNSVRPYALLTLHRPNNVDDREAFALIIEALQEVARSIPILFPAHPRTMGRIRDFGFEASFELGRMPSLERISLLPPLGYLDFLQLMRHARLVLTDSGGVQEETTVLGVPCLTLRANTERPVTVLEGTNVVVGTDKRRIVEESLRAVRGNGRAWRLPELWDGRAAQRIVAVLIEKMLR